jgi:hypothetical protein
MHFDRLVVLGCALPFLGACPTPGQAGGLAAVDLEGLTRRMDALCGAGLGNRLGGKACEPNSDAAAPTLPDAEPRDDAAQSIERGPTENGRSADGADAAGAADAARGERP